jgi:hypothetical protein
MRPVAHVCGEAVLDRIEMDVVHMPLEIVIVADRVLPESPLPQCMFSVWVARDRHARSGDGRREPALDELPPNRIVGIPLRQRHDDMQMVRQDNDGVDRKGMGLSRLAKGGTQCVDVHDQHTRCSIDERRREEIRSARNKIPPVSNHAAEYPGFRCAQSGLRFLPDLPRQRWHHRSLRDIVGPMKQPKTVYPDISDILNAKAERRRDNARRSFGEKIAAMEALREELAPFKRLREQRRAARQAALGSKTDPVK